MGQPTVFTVCGLPGSGKTTFAQKVALDHGAVCFSADAWVLHLYGSELPVARFLDYKERVWELAWQVAGRLLELRIDVVLDFSFYLRSERDVFRQRAEAAGATFRMYYLDCPRELARARIEARNREHRPGTFAIAPEDFDRLAATLQPPARDEAADIIRVQAEIDL